MSRRVDQVEGVVFIGHARRRELDGNALFPLQIHGIQNLILHFSLIHGARNLKQPISKRGFAMIDMGDNTKIPDVLWIIHVSEV